MLNCLKDDKRCIHVSYHILDCVEEKNTTFTMKQPYMLHILHCQYHACWCPGDLRSWGVEKHGIDHIIRNTPALTSKELRTGNTNTKSKHNKHSKLKAYLMWIHRVFMKRRIAVHTSNCRKMYGEMMALLQSFQHFDITIDNSMTISIPVQS